jgi:hypothetical protein
MFKKTNADRQKPRREQQVVKLPARRPVAHASTPAHTPQSTGKRPVSNLATSSAIRHISRKSSPGSLSSGGQPKRRLANRRGTPQERPQFDSSSDEDESPPSKRRRSSSSDSSIADPNRVVRSALPADSDLGFVHSANVVAEHITIYKSWPLLESNVTIPLKFPGSTKSEM